MVPILLFTNPSISTVVDPIPPVEVTTAGITPQGGSIDGTWRGIMPIDIYSWVPVGPPAGYGLLNNWGPLQVKLPDITTPYCEYPYTARYTSEMAVFVYGDPVSPRCVNPGTTPDADGTSTLSFGGCGIVDFGNHGYVIITLNFYCEDSLMGVMKIKIPFDFCIGC